MKLGTWFLTRLFICATSPSTWSPRNATTRSRDRATGMKNDILKLTEKGVLQKSVNSRSSVLISSCQDGIKRLLSRRVFQCPPAFSGRKTFILCSKPTPKTLACTDFTVMKSRQAGRPAQRQQEEPVCSQLLALTAGLLGGGGMSSQLCSLGRKRLISARLPFRDSTAQALFHLQMIKWSTGQLQTEGRSSRLSPGFLNQHDWISQRKAAVAMAGSMTFPEKCSPV